MIYGFELDAAGTLLLAAASCLLLHPILILDYIGNPIPHVPTTVILKEAAAGSEFDGSDDE
jgi:hypothetical protein